MIIIENSKLLFNIMELRRIYSYPNNTTTFYSTSRRRSASMELNNLWITDNTGKAIQHLHYLPFGEDLVDQRNSSWNAPYTFSGKEKDVETGYGYFGARYYDSKLSVWLSVDPMSDKYPNMSPYNYCANNPVILVDPDGRFFVSKADKMIANLYSLKLDIITASVSALLKINPNDSELKDRLDELKAAKKEFIELKNDRTIGISLKEFKDDESATTEYSEYKNGVHYINITCPDFSEENFELFAHELKHIYQFKKGELSFGKNGGAGDMYDYYDEYDAYKRSAAISGLDLCLYIETLDTDAQYNYARSQMFRITVAPKFYKMLDKNENIYIKQKQ
jgi:RHS repeat-associated protein